MYGGRLRENGKSNRSEAARTGYRSDSPGIFYKFPVQRSSDSGLEALRLPRSERPRNAKIFSSPRRCPPYTYATCPWPLSSALILFPAENPEKILTCYQKNGMVKTVIRLTDLSGIDHGKYNAIISRPSGHFHGCPDRGLFSMEKTAFRNRVKATYHRMKTEKRRKTHDFR